MQRESTELDGYLFNSEQVADMKAARADYEARLAADRVTAEWKTAAARRPSDLSEGPLFGGRRQKALSPQGEDETA